jgi:hypothetical protein
VDSNFPARARLAGTAAAPQRTNAEPGRSSHDRRVAFDTILQSSVVDLFHSMGIAVAPVERTSLRPDRVRHNELAASIQFTGRGFNGTLSVGVPPEVFAHMAREKDRAYDGRDWVRETTNQVFGRLKRRLLQFQVELNAGLPSALTKDGFERERARPGFAVYAFRALRGDVLVTLSGDIDYSVLAYANASNVPHEGDVILF